MDCHPGRTASATNNVSTAIPISETDNAHPGPLRPLDRWVRGFNAAMMAQQVMKLLEEIHAGGTTIVMVTHDPELAKRAGRNIHLIDGRVCTDEDEQTQQGILQAARLNGGELLAARV